MINRLFFVLGFLMIHASVFCQKESETTKFLSPRYAFQTTHGDLDERFGSHSSLGITFGLKHANNLYYGVNSNFTFGNDVREPGLIRNLLSLSAITLDGDSVFEIIGQENRPASVLLQQRGFNISADFGRFFRFKNSQNESGILTTIGVGFMQHNIRFETQLDEVPQLEGDFEKGYDRLTNGILLSQNVGWLFLNENFGGSFYIGLEAMQGFTQSRRSFNFDTMSSELGINRFDMTLGMKVAWIVPIDRSSI